MNRGRTGTLCSAYRQNLSASDPGLADLFFFFLLLSSAAIFDRSFCFKKSESRGKELSSGGFYFLPEPAGGDFEEEKKNRRVRWFKHRRRASCGRKPGEGSSRRRPEKRDKGKRNERNQYIWLLRRLFSGTVELSEWAASVLFLSPAVFPCFCAQLAKIVIPAKERAQIA